MSRIVIIRAFALYVPVMGLICAWLRQQPVLKQQAALLLSSLWAFVFLIPVNLLAIRLEWWRFHASGGLFLGIPADLLLGWAILWGGLPVLLFLRTPIVITAAAAFGLDWLLMPALHPVVELGPPWFAGEAVALGLCFIPAQLLARWTTEDRRLYGRVLLQVILFAALFLGALPAIVLANTGGTWDALLRRPLWATSLLLQLLAVPAVIGLTAVQEFATRGHGTPLPYDPPSRLVVSGPYAFVTNPMQISAMLMLMMWGVLLHSVWVVAAGVMAHIYSIGLATFDETNTMQARFGEAWIVYRKAVRNWIPLWRPWRASLGSTTEPRARLYVSATCGMCSEVGRWFKRQRATALEIVSAEDCEGKPLQRISYDAGDGSGLEQGVAAIARGLEHINLAWAFLGWSMRLPLVRQCLQLLVDASGGEKCLLPTGRACARASTQWD